MPVRIIQRLPGFQLFASDALFAYPMWDTPTCIISDGPYGLGKYPGEPSNPSLLPDWYESHIEAWALASMPFTTLWFWNTEIGWAAVHPVLEKHGWEYRECCIWNKGISHIAGNCNSKTIRGVPVVTEVAVRYVRKSTVRPFCTIHANQKPLELMERQILLSTDEGDVVWEPFGGMCSASAAALVSGRRAFAAEENPEYAEYALERIRKISSSSR